MRGQRHLGTVLLTAMMGLTTPVIANEHPLQQCDKMYRKAYDKLTPEQRQYVLARSGSREDLIRGTVENRRAVAYLDVNADGQKKEFIVESVYVSRLCEGDPSNWQVKSNSLIYEDPTGQRRMVHWFGGLVRKVGYDREKKEIVLTGNDMNGRLWEERVDYATGGRRHIDGIVVENTDAPRSHSDWRIRTVNARQSPSFESQK